MTRQAQIQHGSRVVCMCISVLELARCRDDFSLSIDSCQMSRHGVTVSLLLSHSSPPLNRNLAVTESACCEYPRDNAILIPQESILRTWCGSGTPLIRGALGRILSMRF